MTEDGGRRATACDAKRWFGLSIGAEGIGHEVGINLLLIDVRKRERVMEFGSLFGRYRLVEYLVV